MRPLPPRRRSRATRRWAPARCAPALWLAVLCVLLTASAARAWHDEGHYYAALAAAQSLPGDVPAFFRAGGEAMGHFALDPDVVKHPRAPRINDTEAPEHYYDFELLPRAQMPPDRYAWIELCRREGVSVEKVGLLPYAITEWAERLMVAFAEHRRWPDNPLIRQKCLFYAGVLSHYTADLQMPLHTTVHWDGRALPDGESPRSGVHAKVDALPTKVPFAEHFAEPLDPTEPLRGDLLTAVMTEFMASHALVDRVYELEPRLPDAGDLTLTDAEVRQLAIERTRAAARFTAEVMLTAWRRSAEVDVPFWMDRAVFDETFDPAKVPPQPGR